MTIPVQRFVIISGQINSFVGIREKMHYASWVISSPRTVKNKRDMNSLDEIRQLLSQRNLVNECTFSATRSSGPGGQNVNKVSSRVELRFHVSESAILSPVEKFLLLSKLAGRINNEGYLVIDCQEDRSQHRNKELVIEKFLSLLSVALLPRKKRKPTRPTPSSRVKRLESKKKLGNQKKQRKRPEI